MHGRNLEIVLNQNVFVVDSSGPSFEGTIFNCALEQRRRVVASLGAGARQVALGCGIQFGEVRYSPIKRVAIRE